MTSFSGGDARQRAAAQRFLRWTLVTVAAIGCATFGLFTWWDRVATLQQAQFSRREAATLMEAHLRATVDGQRAALSEIAAMLGDSGTLVVTDQVRQRLRALTSSAAVSHWVLDAAGKAVATDAVGVPPGLDLADRAFFTAHLAAHAPETFVGSLNRGRTTGVMLIPVSQAVRGPDGRLLGVVEASLSARAFADFYERLKPTPDAAFAIHTADGSIVVRLPLPEDEPPKGIQVGSPVFAMLQSAPSGTFIGASPVDGLERVGAYSKVEGYPLVVVASVTVESALAGWRQRTVRNAAFCLAALAVVTLLTRYGMARTRRELDAQDRLVMSEQRTWHVADAMPSMLFQADGEGRILWRNLWWHRYTGLPRGGTAAASAWEVVHPDDGERAQADWKRALRDRKPFVDELRYRRSDGRYRWHLMRVEPVSYHRGKVVEWLGVGVDIEEQKEVERAVTLARDAERKANAAKSRFLAAVSHDLRQPFQAMRLFYEVLGQARLDSRSSDSLRRMGDAMAAGEQLLDALLDIAMLEAGQVTVKPADIDLAALVGQVVAEAGPLAAAKGLRLTFVPAAAAPARSDPALLRRIVGNLIANAIRYTDSGGVLVGLRRRRGRLAIEVWDTGRGIPADQLDEVFEEFSQLHNPERDRTHGLGLGLAVVKRTATLLGHDVDVRSCLGKGSVFRVALDRLPEAA